MVFSIISKCRNIIGYFARFIKHLASVVNLASICFSILIVCEEHYFNIMARYYIQNCFMNSGMKKFIIHSIKNSID